MSNGAMHRELVTALDWYVEQGVTEIVQDEVINHTAVQEPIAEFSPQKILEKADGPKEESPAFLGKSDAYDEAVKLVKTVNTLEELRRAIEEFDGVALKKTATNVVFADGNPEAEIMFIGEAPGADEDRLGKPFVGVSGQLMDRMIAHIGLSREESDAKKAVYISNILNWRPPGNRTPSPAEIEVSLPFIEKHIQLIKPKIVVLWGGVAAKALLNRNESISRLRKNWHEYSPILDGIGDHVAPTMATYHPSYLLRTPLQKKAAWFDMLMLQKKISQ